MKLGRIKKLVDNTTGSVSNTSEVNDTTASVKDDLATITAKLNEVIDALVKRGLIEPE